jgi:preprotein translocase subunit YajC
MSVLLGTAQSAGGGFGLTLIYIVVFFGIMWFMLIRPQKKKEKEIADMQNSIKVGNEVLLQSGLYGKVVDIINDVVIVEFGLNKAVRIPVKKVAIAGVQAPNLSISKQPEVGTRVVEDGVEYEYVEVEEEVIEEE